MTIAAGVLAPLENDDAWAHLPPTIRGGGNLPVWARILAKGLPRTTAALLLLDRAQRTATPLDPALRAAVRYAAAHLNHCRYALEMAEADARRAGIDHARLVALEKGDESRGTPAELAALNFARKLTRDSDSVTDDDFGRVVNALGERQAATLVLLLACANFQDRLLLCLGVQGEPAGLYEPLDVEFAADAFVTGTTAPHSADTADPAVPANNHAPADAAWLASDYELLQQRLEAQRNKPTRLRIPDWDEFSSDLPAGLFPTPSDVIWYRICFGYAPELAVPFEVFMRTAAAETSPHWDRVFGQSLFWVTTKAVECPYCMGHCEMVWEVAGLSASEVAERSRLLAGSDWSQFPVRQQQAFTLALTLAKTPWQVTREMIARLFDDFGPARALPILLNACRYHYMTRISNGFQLTLERENVFYQYYNVRQPG